MRQKIVHVIHNMNFDIDNKIKIILAVEARFVMQMRQTRQMQIDEDTCIRNWTDKLT